MSNCKDCRFWGMAWPNPEVNKRRCEFLSDCEPDIEDDGMIDDDGTSRSFYTGPDFGCVHFEAKPKEGDVIGTLFGRPIIVTNMGDPGPIAMVPLESVLPPQMSATAVEGGVYRLIINGADYSFGPIKLGPNWYQLPVSGELSINGRVVDPGEVKEFCVTGITQEQWDAEHPEDEDA